MKLYYIYKGGMMPQRKYYGSKVQAERDARKIVRELNKPVEIMIYETPRECTREWIARTLNGEFTWISSSLYATINPPRRSKKNGNA